MTTTKREDSVASFEEWLGLRDKAAEWDKPDSKFRIQWDQKRQFNVHRGVDISAQMRREGRHQALSRYTTPGSHCLADGHQEDELQRFDELARRAAIYLGRAELKGEAARDFLVVLLKNYFLGQARLRKEVGLVGNHEGAISSALLKL